MAERNPQHGQIRISQPGDYPAGIMVEMFDSWNYAEPHFAVPDWEEMGMGDLAGPFNSVAEAAAAVAQQ